MKPILVILSAFVPLTLGFAQPNIVIILADDATYRDLEVYGGQAKTPNMNALAKQGMKFNQCFQAAPMCSPTRHSLYTGYYPVKSGAYPNHTYTNDDVTTLPQYLKPLGYRVALSGKTHINPKETFTFEYSSAPSPDGGNKKGDIDFAAIDRLFEESKRDGNPFCLVVASKEPHAPHNRGNPEDYPPESLQLRNYWHDTPATRERYSKVLAEITVFDQQVGQCLKLLEKHGLSEDTMVVALSEQGSDFTRGKWSCYEDGVQSGCIIRWPGVVAEGVESEALIEYVDFVPTILEVAGLETPEVVDGRSFLSVLKGETDHHKDYTYSIHTTVGIINMLNPYGIRAVRSQQYRYIYNLTPEVQFRCALDRGDWFKEWEAAALAGNADAAYKTRLHKFRPREELYDITTDPDCLNNLAHEPEFSLVKTHLNAKLFAWMKDQGDLGQETEVRAPERLAKNRPK